LIVNNKLKITQDKWKRKALFIINANTRIIFSEQQPNDLLLERRSKQPHVHREQHSFISTGSDKVLELSNGRSVDELRAGEGTADWLALRTAESISAGHA